MAEKVGQTVTGEGGDSQYLKVYLSQLFLAEVKLFRCTDIVLLGSKRFSRPTQHRDDTIVKC